MARGHPGTQEYVKHTADTYAHAQRDKQEGTHTHAHTHSLHMYPADSQIFNVVVLAQLAERSTEGSRHRKVAGSIPADDIFAACFITTSLNIIWVSAQPLFLYLLLF